MKLYIAMWVRGKLGNDATKDDVEPNKAYAVNVAQRIRQAVEPFHTVVCPHEDPVLNFIDAHWLADKNEYWVDLAMLQCEKLLMDCDVLVVFDRGYLSAGIEHEKKVAEVRQMPIFDDEKDLTDESLEQLVLFLNTLNDGDSTCD